MLSGPAATRDHSLPVADDFEWEMVRSEPVMALVPLGHALGRKKSVELLRLKDLPFILFEPGFALTRLVLDACRRCGFQPTIAARSSQIEFIVELVAADLGIAFLPRMIAEELNHRNVRCVLLREPQTEWKFVMIWRRGAYLPPAARAWLAIWRETRTHDGV